MSQMVAPQELDSRVLKMVERGGEGFSILPGVGETYVVGAPVLYCWLTMAKTSALAGQQVRRFVHQFDGVKDAVDWAESFNKRYPKVGVRLNF